MPLGRRVARLNRMGLNRISRHIVPWAPGFGLVIHHGRRSGREYRTPVNVFRRADHYVMALTYGPEADWVRNVLAASGCVLLHRRRTVTLVAPRLVHDTSGSDMPLLVRTVLRLTRSYDYLHLDIATDHPGD